MAYTDIDKPDDYFNTVTYTGNGASSRNITGVGFQPDFTWIKQRNGSFSHVVGNSVSGDNKFLATNGTGAEGTDSSKFRTFVSDGFQVGNHNGVNGSSNTYVGWSWLGGGTASSNTDGSITSTVSANTTSGFSIVSYTGNGTSGATVGHGLGSEVKFIIIKNRDAGDSWITGHSAIGFTEFTKLDEDGASGTSSGFFNNTAPTSSVFSIGNQHDVNASGEDLIAYCFAEKKGFSKFGSYTGNGSTDGTFVYTGFKPAWFMTKRTDSANSWVMFDNKRSSSGGFNEIDYSVNANSSGAEETSSTSTDVDFCSNGIKITEDNGAINASGGTYIYMAFAENPFVTSTGIPGTAR